MKSPLQFSFTPETQKNSCSIENCKGYMPPFILPKQIKVKIQAKKRKIK